MSQKVFATKGNLIKTKKSLKLAVTGFELLDRKRNVLLRETLAKFEDAKKLEAKLFDTYRLAYEALEKANVSLGLCNDLAALVPAADELYVSKRSVMGIMLPSLSFNPSPPRNYYGFYGTNELLDEAYRLFSEAKLLTIQLAEAKTAIWRLSAAVNKTQKRANALKNVVIPDYTDTLKRISSQLEEKEREEFSSLKLIKNKKLPEQSDD